MKSATKIKSVILFIGIAVGVWFWNCHKSSLPTAVAGIGSPTHKKSETPPSPKAGDQPKIVQPYARTPFLGLKDPRCKEYEARRKTDPEWEWKTPIEFFGKVVDEQNNPVANADIEIEWNGTSEKYGGDGVMRKKLASDADGAFVINGITGKQLDVFVKKEGFYTRRSINNVTYEYADFWEPKFIEPDRNSPIVFHLLKRPIAEPTYHIGERMLLPPPSWVTHLDLLKKPAETTGVGDVTLRIIRPPNPGYKDPFDWELEIEGNNGAEFVESDEEFMLRAPADGYRGTIAKSYHQVQNNGSETIRFYIRSKTRKLYAAVSLEVTPYYLIGNEDKACIIISATVNPNDSPNVEYDKEMNIREKSRR
ncbi:MAG: carboxypeptidase-like regulatory domain-containing protein [Luteolibacter sp.]